MQLKRYVLTMLVFILIATSITMVNIDYLANTYTPKYKHDFVRHNPPNIEIRTVTGISPPNSGDWNISDTTIIENEILIINGSIFIESGGTLILKNSKIYMNLNSDGEHWIEVLNGGNLTLIDSTITAYNLDNNYYIKVDNGAKFYMEGSEISYAGYTWGTNGDKTGLWINTNNVTIKDSSIYKNWYSVYIDGSNVVIFNCSIYNNSFGVRIYQSSNVLISNCSIFDSGGGVEIWYGNNVTVSNCSIFENNGYGVDIYQSSNVLISNCSIFENNHYGVVVASGNNVTILGNTLLKNTMAVYGSKDMLSSVVIDDSNTLNGNPIKYYFNITNVAISEGNWGELILAYCQNISVANLSASSIEIYQTNNTTISNSIIFNSTIGVSIYQSSNILIFNNSIYNNHYGINTYSGSNMIIISECAIHNNFDGVIIGSGSSNVIISDCSIYNNFDGVDIAWSNNVTVFNCSIFENNNYGVIISHSNNVSIVFNNILNNVGAFYVSSNSYDIAVYLNNFIGNFYRSYDYGSSHFYNDAYGNYWSDYQGSDENYDLVGDTAYQVDSDSIDRYPLIFPIEFIGSDIAVVQNYAQIKENEVCIYAKVMSISKLIDDVVLVYYENGIPLTTTMNYNAITDTYYTKIKINENSTYYQILVKSASKWYNTSKKQILLNDIEPPSITNVLWFPFRPTISENVTVMCVVSDSSGIAQVIFSYYDSQWHNVTMQYNSSVGVYQTTIAGVNSSVLFKIYVQDNSGNWAVTRLYNIEFEEPEGETGDQPPSIVNVLWVPYMPVTGENVVIYVWVFDDYRISTVILSYYTSGWHNTTMQYNSSLGAYVAVISDFSVNNTLFFRIYVFDTVGQCTISKVYGISIGTAVSEVPSKEVTFFGMTSESLIMMSFALIISLVVGLGIGLRRRR